MILLGANMLVAYQAKHSETRKELERWRKVMQKASFSSGRDLHNAFRKTHDFVRPHCHVFDIVGGNHRLVAVIDFQGKTVAIEKIMNHKEYDRWECS
ncbi:MAG: hypothetical protein CO113_14670 [Elusimicrobia bacterium CG_4_9_14_3_um_filter_62_55]|nr:MAG: hypothetical protein COR54_12690 [Elusimicrobia bacterium CG22_combo_CG10-13_8_21_14_all_63_91]PJA12010.1 MAG: hypothetical protein COX66_18200 [Elusimicrobia bacterium CG_4_10_14_0_2_um_filter_63_34]PJB24277.1 MAG: hypothetical protein CO113_14670 [Elusimicrobia bacterium CG_4_9_14_3_um_filter_62_55]